jgi:hypothetical protein
MATENYLLSVQGVVQESFQESVLCFQSTGLSSTDTLDTANDLITAWRTHLESLWQDIAPSDYQVRLYSARRAFPHPSGTAYQQIDIDAVVGGMGSCNALNVCPAVHLIPPMGTKTGGRVFLPSAADSAVIDNTYDAGYVASVTSFFSNAISGSAGSGTNWKLAIFSRLNTSAVLALNFGLSPRIGFQSRRRKPVGGA